MEHFRRCPIGKTEDQVLFRYRGGRDGFRFGFNYRGFDRHAFVGLLTFGWRFRIRLLFRCFDLFRLAVLWFRFLCRLRVCIRFLLTLLGALFFRLLIGFPFSMGPGFRFRRWIRRIG